MDFEALGITKQEVLDAIRDGVHDAFADVEGSLVESGDEGGYGILGAIKVGVAGSMPLASLILREMRGAVYEATVAR